MYIEIVPNRNSRPTLLLREGWREGKKVCKRTLANLTDWPAPKVEALRRVLKDEPLISADEAFSIERSWPHGHVEAVVETMRRLGLDKLIGAKRPRERDIGAGDDRRTVNRALLEIGDPTAVAQHHPGAVAGGGRCGRRGVVCRPWTGC